jgi:hypothetical protein
MNYISCRGQRSHAFLSSSLMPYLVIAWFSTRPITHISPQVWTLYKMEFGEPRGTFLGHQLLHESLLEYHSKFFFLLKSLWSGTSRLFNSALYHLSPQRTISVTCKHLSATSTINLLIFTPRAVIGFVNINS